MKVNSFFLVAALAVTTSLSSSLTAAELSLEERLQRLEQQAETRNQLQTRMSMQLIELQKEVKELRGLVEEHEYKLQQIQERQRDLYRDIESRLSRLPASGGASPAQTPVTQRPPVISQNTAKEVKQVVSGSDGRSEFEAAFKLVRNKDYSNAIQQFEAFLVKYPTGAYSDNARFWIGQVYFAQGKLDEAEKQFNRMRTEYPDSSKMSAAILKLADIKAKKQQWAEAKTLYNEVVSKYTGASQQLARKALQDIKQKGH
ncbi:tol-pal system protein YbgF [Aliikangiella sp. G2MR2-5]|uniref:tol-pal system protein YbgF n=1 Tax=Aliikangiella sp. G2MR2-5 TaxID=2788943 RepID=UPI0018AC14B2|nr:tol-pal system protein YbgF [Aliikangiella sp. G2MR2-5]